MSRALTLFLLASACQDYEVTRLGLEDTFRQEGGNLTVDFLWVMDDSPTMSEEQENVVTNIGPFVDALNGFNADWQVGVIRTAVDDETAGALVAPLLGPLDADIEASFAAAVDVGVVGSVDEQGLEAMRLATSEPLLSTTNAGLVRAEADLAVVVVSDEDDHSEAAVSLYRDHLVLLKGDGHVRASGVVGELPAGCATPYAAADPADRYVELVEALGGIAASICRQDFSSTMKDLALNGMNLHDTFYLSTIPEPGSIEVRKDGVLLYERPENGWQYDAGANAIVVDGYAVPGPDSVLLVNYFEWLGYSDSGA